MPSTQVRNGLYWSETTRTWHHEFRFRGVKRNGDTGCPTRALAEKWLTAYKARLAGAEVGLEAPEPIPTLAAAYEDWKRAKTGRAGGSWRETVDRALHLHLAPLLPLPLSALSTPVVEAQLARYLQTKGHSNGGANVVLRALNSVVNHGCRSARILRPFDLKPYTAQERPRATFTAMHFGTLLRKLEELGAPSQAVDVVRLMFGLGLRVSEACKARVEALDRTRWELTPWDPKAGTKGREAVALPVPVWLRLRLAELAGKRTTGYLITGRRGAHPGRMMPGLWLKKAGEKLDWPWLTPHVLRGAYATYLSEQGVTPETIQRLLRHESYTTTRRYLRPNHQDALVAANGIARAAGLPMVPVQSPASKRKVR